MCVTAAGWGKCGNLHVLAVAAQEGVGLEWEPACTWLQLLRRGWGWSESLHVCDCSWVGLVWEPACAWL